LRDPSEASVRAALAAAAPELAAASLALPPGLDRLREPQWQAATAVVDGRYVVKFAWSEVAAVRIRREAEILALLSELRVPQLVGASIDPVAFVTRLVDGVPLKRARAGVAAQLAEFLTALHAPRMLAAAEERVGGLVPPRPQADTDELRARLGRFLDRRRTALVRDWCAWVDSVLAAPTARTVLVHGDLHGFNQVWDPAPWRLLLVTDFETAGPAEPEYDLRYLPPLELADAVAEHYGGELDRARWLAWHVRTALGDALWRSEAGIALPGGGTPSTYVDELSPRLREFV
jgi:aminoglycoside phosphotransferase (APT) family kinase protein